LNVRYFSRQMYRSTRLDVLSVTGRWSMWLHSCLEKYQTFNVKPSNVWSDKH